MATKQMFKLTLGAMLIIVAGNSTASAQWRTGTRGIANRNRNILNQMFWPGRNPYYQTGRTLGWGTLAYCSPSRYHYYRPGRTSTIQTRTRTRPNSRLGNTFRNREMERNNREMERWRYIQNSIQNANSDRILELIGNLEEKQMNYDGKQSRLEYLDEKEARGYNTKKDVKELMTKKDVKDHEEHFESLRKLDALKDDSKKRLLAQRVQRHNPPPLTPGQLDPYSGKIDWPTLFDNSRFTESCEKLDSLFAERTPSDSGLGSRNCVEVLKVIQQMRKILSPKGRPREFDSANFTFLMDFLRSLEHESKSKYAVEPRQLVAHQ